jgi:RNA polymerase sigma-70 factor (ECF subfamily)
MIAVYDAGVDEADTAALEAELRERCAARDFDAAATGAIRGYGPQLLGFLHGMLHNAEAASEVFAELCEDLWRGLPAFAGRSSFRTWLYTLARHAAFRRLRKHKQARRNLALDETSLVSRIQQEVRAKTLPFLRTEVKSRLGQLRESLPVEDQALLILRVDKKLDWNDLARVLNEGEPLDEAALKRESARLRKRFQMIKDKLRQRAEDEGLLGEE